MTRMTTAETHKIVSKAELEQDVRDTKITERRENVEGRLDLDKVKQKIKEAAKTWSEDTPRTTPNIHYVQDTYFNLTKEKY